MLSITPRPIPGVSRCSRPPSARDRGERGRQRSLDQAISAVAYGGEIPDLGLFDFASTPPDLLTLMDKAASIRGVAVGSAAAPGTVCESPVEGNVDESMWWILLEWLVRILGIGWG